MVIVLVLWLNRIAGRFRLIKINVNIIVVLVAISIRLTWFLRIVLKNKSCGEKYNRDEWKISEIVLILIKRKTCNQQILIQSALCELKTSKWLVE